MQPLERPILLHKRLDFLSFEDQLILAKRKAVYAAAKRQNPARWSGEIRNWEPAGEVWLNPEKPEVEEVEIRDEVA